MSATDVGRLPVGYLCQSTALQQAGKMKGGRCPSSLFVLCVPVHWVSSGSWSGSESGSGSGFSAGQGHGHGHGMARHGQVGGRDILGGGHQTGEGS